MAEDRKYRTGELKEIILSALGISLVLGGSIFLTPNFPIILGSLIKIIKEFKGEKISKPKLHRILKRLEKRKLISLEGRGDSVQVKILEAGQVKLLRYSIKQLLEIKRKDKRWEGKWFLTIFDIPETERNKGDYLRKFLLDIGFYPYQQSVYVYPYECEDEVKLIKRIIEGGNYISYIIAEKLENEEEIRRIFGI